MRKLAISQRHGRACPGMTMWLALCLGTVCILPLSASAESAADFYKGKSVNLAISFPPGGGYDLYARILGRHMGKHIPGNPTIVPQNMPGAGGLRVAQWLAQAAPRDGLTFGTFTRMAHIAPLYDPTQKYDAAKFTWLGAITDAVSVCITFHTSPVKTWQDWLTTPTTFGGTGPSGEVDIFTNVYKNVFGAKVRLAAGYTGTGPAMLAIERGEIDGICGIDWTTLKAQRPHWIEKKQINVLVQTAFRKDPDLPDVPLIMELTKDPEKLQILKLYVSSHEFARPFAAPPGVPAERAAALIAAFEATTKDPAFLAETAKHQMEVAPVSGARLAGMLTELYSTPEPILVKARAAIGR